MQRILLSMPQTSGYEQQYITEALADHWIVPLGPAVDRFEKGLSAFLDADHVAALSSGTAAIHLALVMLGVGPGDEVICQSMTFSASANPIRYCGANPVFVDSEPNTWNMDPVQLERAIKDRLAVTGRLPKAIIPVYLYGMPARIDEILAIANTYGIPVVEDSAEAMGSKYQGRMCGTFGAYGVLSFNGNKMITTSGGGALICPDAASCARVKFFATQAREDRPYYYHTQIGYNYRLSNISAAIGLGQMHVLTDRIARRRQIHDIYDTYLSTVPGVIVHNNPSAEYGSNFWLTTILLDDSVDITPDELRLALNAHNIETRLLWRPMHMQPVYADAPFYSDPSLTMSVGEDLFNRGLCLPSGTNLTDEDIHRVIDAIKDTLAKKK